MLTLAWIEEQLERVMHDAKTMNTVRDCAALLIVRDSLRAQERQAPAPEPQQSSDVLSKPPTLDQVSRALSAVVVTNAEDRKRAEDLMTWVKILQDNG